jgi:adenylate cyclase
MNVKALHPSGDNYSAIFDCCVRELPLTVMFADIRDFTTLSEQWPVREVVNLLNQFYRLASQVVVQEQAGYIFRFLGDGVLAAFSERIEPQTEVRRAFQAALDLIQKFEALKACYPSSIICPKLGIGLARGTAMLSALGPPPAQEWTIIGDTVNTASRLASFAEGEQALCTADVQQFLEPDECQFIGPQSLKGKMRPVAVYRLLPPPAASDKPPQTGQSADTEERNNPLDIQSNSSVVQTNSGK